MKTKEEDETILKALHHINEQKTRLINKQNSAVLNEVLMIAIQQDETDIVKDLIIGQVPINQPNIDGELPLNQAIKNNKLDIIDVLLDKDHDIIHLTNSDGMLPLQIAIQQNNYDVVWKLLTRRAKPNQRNQNGQDAFEIAEQNSEQQKFHGEKQTAKTIHQVLLSNRYQRLLLQKYSEEMINLSNQLTQGNQAMINNDSPQLLPNEPSAPPYPNPM